MPHPPLTRRISVQDAPISQNDRVELADYLATIKHDDELFMRCVRKAVRKLRRYELKDHVWLSHWLPIIERDLNASEN